ncbi:MAG: HvfC/BufC family peptide modification chaperone [Polyangiaceae bacterium]
MTTSAKTAPAWLADFQRRFGDAITTLLDRSTGTLAATPNAYDDALVKMTTDGPTATRSERLAIYNRQYWFRLFTAFHEAYPLTTRLFGAWEMNAHAARFLVANPPGHWDLGRAADGFDSFLEKELAAEDDITRRTLVEAARIDRAWQKVFLAPPVPAFRPSEANALRLLDSKLLRSPAVAIVREHAPLMDLRRRVMREPGETRIEMPALLEAPRFWALVRRDEGTLQLRLDRREAELFDHLETHTVRDALAMLEASSTDEERSALPDKTRAWLARSVENDFWIGLA